MRTCNKICTLYVFENDNFVSLFCGPYDFVCISEANFSPECRQRPSNRACPYFDTVHEKPRFVLTKIVHRIVDTKSRLITMLVNRCSPSLAPHGHLKTLDENKR